MKKLTRKEKVKISRQLKKMKYSPGKHDVHVDGGITIEVNIKGPHAFLPSGRRMPVPEEWWV